MRSCRSCRSRMTKCSASRARVVVERAHLHCASGPAARRQKAVAVGDGRRHDFLHRGRLGKLGAPNGERHDAPAVEVENPANRPSEQQIALPVLEVRVPVHRLRKAERSQRRRQHVGQHVDRRLAALMLAEAQIGALRVSPRARAGRRRRCSCARSPPPPGSARRRRRTPRRPAGRSAALRGRSAARRSSRCGRSAAGACCSLRPAHPAASRCARSAPSRPSRICRVRAGSHDAGSSSVPSSSRSSRSIKCGSDSVLFVRSFRQVPAGSSAT